MNLDLVSARGGDAVRVGYSCPCGCTPRVTYQRGNPEATDACCCGNHFAVGPHAVQALHAGPDDRLESQSFSAPWHESLQAAWILAQPSEGIDSPTHEHHHEDAGA